MENIAIILTGQLQSVYINKLIQAYTNIQNVIVSTWKDQDPQLIEDLSANGFIILLSELPSDHVQNNKIFAAKKGCLYAQSLGFKYVYHSRTDVFPLNFSHFIHSIKDLYESKITVICGLSNSYFLDILVIGPINNMLKFYGKLQDPTDTRCPEVFLLETYYNKKNLSREDIKSEINFCLDRCKNIEFIWFRNRLWADRPSRTIPMMRVISEYCTEPGIYL